jgi:competence protein ComEA
MDESSRSLRLRPGAWGWLAAVLVGLVFMGLVGNTARTGSVIPPEEGRRLDLQTASVRELNFLPGIGGRLAERIVSLRKQQGSIRFEDLRRVKGIGPGKMQKLQAWVTASGEEGKP